MIVNLDIDPQFELVWQLSLADEVSDHDFDYILHAVCCFGLYTIDNRIGTRKSRWRLLALVVNDAEFAKN